ncbi:hypothetical protein [Sorangium sp. So ce204]|uniref:hypothetical protein n=1 Tax=Sorangium sp. So ce204 TaxID=3133288 RepID=UPI003F5F7BE9
MAAWGDNELELRLAAASTPERVASAALLLSDVIRAAYPGLGENSVTMVVSNYSMIAGLRPRDDAGHSAISDVISFARDPERAFDSIASAWGIAKAFAEHGLDLHLYKAELWARGNAGPVARLGDEFMALMRRLSREKKPIPLMRGSTVIYSLVHRVGRANGKTTVVKARIDVDGKPCDVRISTGSEDQFFDAAKNKRVVHAIALDAAWAITSGGTYVFDASSSRARSATPWKPISGAELMKELSGVQQIDSEDLRHVLDDIAGR